MKIFHRVAFLTLILAFGLVTLGGVVHNTGSSLACPDWPLCYGQVFPKMEGGVAIEHSHRLLGALVGLFTFSLVFWAYREKEESQALSRIRTGSLWAAGLVLFQGLLGGLTVLLKISPLMSTTHLAVSQVFIALLFYLVFQSRPQGLKNTAQILPFSPRSFRIGLGLVYFQMLLGAFVRHTGAGVACGVGFSSAFVCGGAENWLQSLWPSFSPARFQMFHRYFALFVAGYLISQSLPVLKKLRQSAELRKSPLRGLLIGSHATVTIQILLGVLTVSFGLSPLVTTLHLVFAMTLWLLLIGQNLILSESSTIKRVPVQELEAIAEV